MAARRPTRAHEQDMRTSCFDHELRLVTSDLPKARGAAFVRVEARDDAGIENFMKRWLTDTLVQ